MTTRVKWSGFASRLVARARDVYKQKNRLKFRRKHEYLVHDEYNCGRNAGMERLDAFDHAVRFMTTETKFKLGYMQEKLLNSIQSTFLTTMFGADLVSNLGSLMKRMPIEMLYSCMAIVYPRRQGKSVITAFAAAVIAVSQPEGNSICYNIGGRQAKAWLSKVMDFLEAFKESEEFGWSLVSRNIQEHIFIRNHKYGTVVKIYSYPGIQSGSANIDLPVPS